nr:hypothetical protein GCM10017611_60070 [Rhodococcus wratislaviensis]
MIGGIACAVVVETHPVDQGAVRGQPEQPGSRVAGLGLGGDGAHLGEPEAEGTPRVDAGRILVEPGGQTERRREVESEHGVPQYRIVHDENLADELTQRREPRDQAHRSEGQVMNPLRRNAEHHP